MGQEANLTLYTNIKDSSKLIESAKKEFKEILIDIKEDKNKISITLMDQTVCDLYLNDNEEEVKNHCLGMMNYFNEAPCTNKNVMDNTLLQISLFNTILGINFLVDDNDERTSSIIGRIYEVAKTCAAVILYPNMSLYTNKGELILSIEGTTQLEEYYPISNSDIIDTKKKYDKEDSVRYEKIKKEIEAKGYPIIQSLMGTQLTLTTLKKVSVEEIVKRFLAVFSCSVCAEGILMEGGSKDIALAQFISLDQIYGCGSYLSEEEKEFIENEIDKKSAVKFSWRYECAAILLWSIGLYEIDEQLNTICDVSKIAKTLRRFKNFEELCKAAKLVSDEELLDLHTKVLYYHWSCIELSINKKEIKDINPDVIQEYHYALNWLIQANQTLNWDKISCNT